ncbi:MAG: 2-succinyl-5-enolpyruvyl-6-hydroxy-3-cyclohexene-1-carboxylic-acid synthase, partial [Cyanobacteria bacterium P01_G01_bin.49]
MLFDFSNVNTVWSSLLIETLNRLGLKTAIICPGSRSTPLTVALANHSQIETIPVLDERSAAFFAMGIAKRRGTPVALICTSGTAGANFYPAIIEAKESRVSLLVFTADRPPELRNCHAGQAIDQVKLYGHYCNWQTELSIPSIDIAMLRYLRQTMVFAWERSLFPNPGVVHLNCPFREPLAPIIVPEVQASLIGFDGDNFLTGITDKKAFSASPFSSKYLKQWASYSQGIIIAGVAHTQDPKTYCQVIAKLSQYLNYPVLAEALSPVRNFADLNPNLITTYDLILRNPNLAQKLIPDIVIQIGELPTSKELRKWLEDIQPQHWIISSTADNFDSLHNQT